MKNFVQTGDIVTVTAPYALAAGDGALVGSIFGVAQNAAAISTDVELAVEGVFDITALGTDVAAQGTKVYWDNTNKRITITSAGNTLVGAVTVAKASGPTVARVRIDGCIR
jgi:predicted RecA/RadA family phage recombinase